MKPITSSDISIVVQGPISRAEAGGEDVAYACMQSLRAHFPQAELIISTWKDQDVVGLSPDIMVVSNDPGGDTYENVTRQALSTAAGIKQATRPYVLKFRPDLKLLGPQIAVVDTTPPPPAMKPFHIAKSRITCTNLFVRKPLNNLFPLLFHPSDLVHFGEIDDLARFWREPNGGRASFFGTIQPVDQLLFVPEQLLMLRWIHDSGAKVNITRSNDVTNELVFAYEHYLATNFNIVDWSQSGIIFPERFLSDTKLGVYSRSEFAALQRAITEGKYRPPKLTMSKLVLSKMVQQNSVFRRYLFRYWAKLNPATRMMVKTLIAKIK